MKSKPCVALYIFSSERASPCCIAFGVVIDKVNAFFQFDYGSTKASLGLCHL